MDMDRECADKHCDRDTTTRNVGRRILSERESELDNDGVAVSRRMVGRVVGASGNNRESVGCRTCGTVSWRMEQRVGNSSGFVGKRHKSVAGVGNQSVTKTSVGRQITC